MCGVNSVAGMANSTSTSWIPHRVAGCESFCPLTRARVRAPSEESAKQQPQRLLKQLEKQLSFTARGGNWLWGGLWWRASVFRTRMNQQLKSTKRDSSKLASTERRFVRRCVARGVVETTSDGQNVFSRAMSGGRAVRSFAAGSWNSRALCHREERSMKRKRNYVRCLLRRLDVLCLQEVHGSEDEMRRVLSPFRDGWHFFLNPG